MKKYTPGPWIVNNKGKHWNNQSLDDIEICYGTDGECICDTVYEPEDAQLIAAAPDLVEALEAIIEKAPDSGPLWFGSTEMGKARLALKKAGVL